MKPDDEELPSEEELREARALAEALEGASGAAPAAERPPPEDALDDALEAAALLRHARAPIAVPPAVEPTVAAQAVPLLNARRTRGRRRTRAWIATSLLVPAAAAAWLLFSTTAGRHAPLSLIAPPAPTADLLAAQAEATRGGGQAGAALARLDLEMRAYRRRYHEGLRRRLGEAP